MDIVKIESGFLKGIFAKVVSKAIKEKTGYDVKVRIHDAEAKVVNGDGTVHLDVDINIDGKELSKLLNSYF